jgi:hypothetical protein
VYLFNIGRNHAPAQAQAQAAKSAASTGSSQAQNDIDKCSKDG